MATHHETMLIERIISIKLANGFGSSEDLNKIYPLHFKPSEIQELIRLNQLPSNYNPKDYK